MTESEDKKWVIGRMEAFLTVNIDDLESRGQKTSLLFDKITKGVEKGRNAIMGIVGGIVSITLGLAAIQIITSPTTEWTLTIGIGIGAFFFFLSNRINSIISKSLQPITTSQLKAKDVLNRLKLRIIDETVDLDSMSYDKLKMYYEYTTIVGIGVSSVILLEALEKGKKSSIYIKFINKIFDEPITIFIKGLNATHELYKTRKEQLEKNGFHEGLYLEMMQPLIDYFEKNPISEPEKSKN